MTRKYIYNLLLILLIAAGSFLPVSTARAEAVPQTSTVTAYDLIAAMNTLRISNGLPALTEDAIIDAVAQSTAEAMAAANMSWHMGDVSGRLQSAGYGGGSKVWGTENFAMGNYSGIDEIMVVWADPSHMIPAINPAYCNIGAGIATASNGFTYYVLQAAYTSGKSCGDYTSSITPGSTTNGGATNGGDNLDGSTGSVSQIIVQVKVAEPDAEGKIWHVVQSGQSFWAIAVTYGITIKDIQTWNNLSSDAKLQPGQKLFIPSANTEGYATPTPVGMIQTNPPDANGRITHAVQSYQTLTTIAAAYGVPIELIASQSRISVNNPLQIGQELVIYPGNMTPTPTATLTPTPLTAIQKLTPAADGRYYHTTGTGENLTLIASLYQIDVNQLMAWNGLNGGSVLQVGQKLVLEVTPPATITPTPEPATITSTPSNTPTATRTQATTPTPVYNQKSFFGSRGVSPWLVFGVLGAGLAALVFLYLRSKSFLKKKI